MKGNLYDHEKLAKLRSERYTQEQFADMLGINKVSLSRIENGNNGSYEIIMRICQKLDVDSRDIFYSSKNVSLET